MCCYPLNHLPNSLHLQLGILPLIYEGTKSPTIGYEMTNRWVQIVLKSEGMKCLGYEMTCQLDFRVATMAENMNVISEMKGLVRQQVLAIAPKLENGRHADILGEVEDTLEMLSQLSLLTDIDNCLDNFIKAMHLIRHEHLEHHF